MGLEQPEQMEQLKERKEPEQVDNLLSHLYPPFAVRVDRLLALVNRETSGKYAGLKECRVFEGYRSTARQQWLYAQGRTRRGDIVTQDAVPHWHGWGLAVDIVGYDQKGEPSWDWPDAFWQQVGHAARTQGMEWGGDWRCGDTPHCQMPHAYKVAHREEINVFLTSVGLTVPGA